MLQFTELSFIDGAEIISSNYNGDIKYLLTDSRRAFFAKGVIFFAINGANHDGHKFVADLYQKGVRQFVVEEIPQSISLAECNIIKVPNALHALQQIVAYHRSQFHIPIIGITGSNGKTIIKEWLYQMLMPWQKVVKNPHSYNSQLGVPLSVWQINALHEVGIFEAGISQVGEMQRIEEVIKPTIGIFSNIGSAHDQGFASQEEKFNEKMMLFKNSKVVICCADHGLKHEILIEKGFSWGEEEWSNIQIASKSITADGGKTQVMLNFLGQELTFIIPFVDKASFENCMHCIAYMLYAGYEWSQVQQGLERLNNVQMRLEMKVALNNSHLIDDTYNNDIAGLQIALEFLSHQKQHHKKTVILSDIQQSGLDGVTLYTELNELLMAAGVSKLIGIGPQMTQHSDVFDMSGQFYEETESFLSLPLNEIFEDEIILVKGARSFQFEKIVHALEERIHGTQLEINLDALTNNLNFYRSKVNADTKLMVMVKAFAYGSGSLEIANLLQFHRVDYLGVAYADEGMYLRRNGVYLPIMVMNCSEDSFDTVLKYELEPEIYNLNILRSLIRFLKGRPIGVHLKIDTGMHRLGFEDDDIKELLSLLSANSNIEVKSIFSHLAGADSSDHNTFSQSQVEHLKNASAQIESHLNINALKHILNSSGIIRFPEYQLNMVRLGIGLYGVEGNNLEQDALRPVSKLKTIISQIKTVKANETIGYGRRGKVNVDSRIATIAIGYADGFNRGFSNGVGEVWVNGNSAKVIGNVCMDMTMIDVTGLSVKEGDEVEIFGDNISISAIAAKINTIPYEILTSVSQRVKRVYYAE